MSAKKKSNNSTGKNKPAKPVNQLNTKGKQKKAADNQMEIIQSRPIIVMHESMDGE